MYALRVARPAGGSTAGPLGVVAPQPPAAVAVQAKLVLGSANDPLEHEADRIANQVMQGSVAATATAAAGVRCKCAECEGDDVVPRAKRTGVAGEQTPQLVDAVLRSPGSPLPEAARAYFEPRFGWNLSRVRVHTDGQAARSAASLGAAAYTAGSHIVFAQGRYDHNSISGRHLIAHELAHTGQQAAGRLARVQRRMENHPALAEIQGLPMADLLTRLDALPRHVLTDEEAGTAVGGPRLVLAMRAVRARRELDIVGFMDSNREPLKAIPADQFTDILRFLGQTNESERENVNTELPVPLILVKPSGLRLRGEPSREGASDEDADPISNFEAQILLDRSRIQGAVLDPDSGEIIGYLVPSTTGMRRIVDREGKVGSQTEVPIESPFLDPIDFIPGPGAAGKVAAGIGGKFFLKGAAKAVAAKGAKSGSTIALGVIMRLRSISKALSRAAARRGGRAVFGAGRTLARPVTGQAARASGKVDVKLLELATEGRTKLIAAGVDWGKSNIASAKLVVDGKTVFMVVDNPEWALHAEGALMNEVKQLTAGGKSVKVLQVFSERLPCGPGYANCMNNLTSAFPTAEIFYGVSGPMNEASTTRALHVLYGLVK